MMSLAEGSGRDIASKVYSTGRSKEPRFRCTTIRSGLLSSPSEEQQKAGLQEAIFAVHKTTLFTSAFLADCNDSVQRNRQEGKQLAQVCALKVKHFHLCNKIAEQAEAAPLSWAGQSKTLRSTKWWMAIPLILQRDWLRVSLATVGLAVWNGVLCAERWPSLSSDAEDNSVSLERERRESSQVRWLY